MPRINTKLRPIHYFSALRHVANQTAGPQSHPLIILVSFFNLFRGGEPAYCCEWPGPVDPFPRPGVERGSRPDHATPLLHLTPYWCQTRSRIPGTGSLIARKPDWMLITYCTSRWEAPLPVNPALRTATHNGFGWPAADRTGSTAPRATTVLSALWDATSAHPQRPDCRGGGHCQHARAVAQALLSVPSLLRSTLWTVYRHL